MLVLLANAGERLFLSVALCLVNLVLDSFDVAEVTELGRVVLREEDVERLDVAVDNVATVQVVDAQTDVYKHLPEEVVCELLTFLSFDGFLKVSILAVFHDDANGLLRDE